MIDLIFDIVNLAVFIGLGIYLFKKYFLPSLYASHKEDQLYSQNLKQKKADLVSAQNQVDNKIIDQRKVYEELKLKIVQWSTAVAQQRVAKQEESQELYKKLEKRVAKQSECYHLEKVEQQVKPYLIKDLKKELQKYFENENNIRKYFKDIFRNLNSSNN